jgi:AcrR family transcriptional regulator
VNETVSFAACDAIESVPLSDRIESIPISSVIEQTETSPSRGEARSQAILDAALELLAEVGFDRMTMDAVASRAKASKATIYRHWPHKTALVLDALRGRTALVHDVSDSGSLRGDLERCVREAVVATAGIDGSLVVGLLAVAARDPELAALLARQLHDEHVPTITELVRRARERHEVGPEVDPSIVAEVLPATVIMHLVLLGLPGDEVFIRRLVDDVLLPLLTAHPALDGGH